MSLAAQEATAEDKRVKVPINNSICGPFSPQFTSWCLAGPLRSSLGRWWGIIEATGVRADGDWRRLGLGRQRLLLDTEQKMDHG